MTGLEAKRSPKDAMTLDELFGTATDVVTTDLPAADPDEDTTAATGQTTEAPALPAV